MAKRIVIAEDEAIIAEMYEHFIKEMGHEVVGIADTAEDTIKKVCASRPDLVFLDINMDYKTAGIDACRALMQQCPETKIYFVTAYAKEVYEKELAGLHYDGYIDKLNFVRDLDEILR
jgi:DNA-binding NarL/FixJ family response regulator